MRTSKRKGKRGEEMMEEGKEERRKEKKGWDMIREEEGEREGVEEDKGGRKVGEIKEKKKG